MKGIFVAYTKPNYQSEPRWDNSRNVSIYGRKTYQINASLLKHYGAVYSISPVDDEEGTNFNYTSTKRGDVWMYIVELRVEQVFDYRGKNTKVTHMIRVRHETVIEETDHIIMDGVTYEVVHIDSDKDRRLFKTVMVTELR